MNASSVFTGSFVKKSLSLILLAALVLGAVLFSAAPSASAETAELSLADLYEQNVASTVGISTSGSTTGRFGYGYTFHASGSGFILSEDGYILTNWHVVDGASSISVATYDGETYDAELIGGDKSSDVAVLKIDAKKLKPVTLGDSDKLRVGESVCAIGNPLGELSFSLTHGIVSALSRNIRTESGTSKNLIQTDCAINSGNSGGALFNSRGEVIGITNAKYSASGLASEAEIDNVCFAIPINSVKSIVDSIMENGTVVKPYIGVTASPLSAEAAGVTGLSAGALVQSVIEGTPAERAGLRVNDIIVRVGDDEIADADALAGRIAASQPGDVLNFTVYRQGKQVELKVEVGSRTESALEQQQEEEPVETPQPAQQQRPQNGMQGFPGWGGDYSLEDIFGSFFGS